MSGRLPCTWILREPGIGRVTASESSCAARARSLGRAFIGWSVRVLASPRGDLALLGNPHWRVRSDARACAWAQQKRTAPDAMPLRHAAKLPTAVLAAS